MAEIAPTSAEALRYLEDVAADAMSRCGVPAKDALAHAARIRRAVAARFGGRYMYAKAAQRRMPERSTMFVDALPFLKSAMQEVVAAFGIKATAKERILEAEALKIVDHFRGAPVYISMDKGARRAERIAAVSAEFNGCNIAELAERHGVCIQTIYRYLAESRRTVPSQRRRKRAI